MSEPKTPLIITILNKFFEDLDKVAERTGLVEKVKALLYEDVINDIPLSAYLYLIFKLNKPSQS